MARRAAIAVFLLIVSIVGFYACVFYPLTQYVLEFAQKAGQPPTAWQTSGLGVIVAAGNSLISNCIWLGVPHLGFRRKDQADIVTFLMRSLLVLVNTLSLVMLTAQKLAAVSIPE